MANTELLDRVGRQLVGPQVKPYTLFIRRWLPQYWVFTTESGSSTLLVEKSGASAAVRGASPTPDVTVEWVDASLDAALTVALTHGDRRSIPRSPQPSVKTHTKKGEDALAFLGRRLGLG